MTSRPAPSGSGRHAPPCCVALAGPADLEGFRREARRLSQLGVPPEQVTWQVRHDAVAGETASLWEDAAQPSHAKDRASSPAAEAASAAARAAPPSVPRGFVELCQEVALHRDPQRFALMYRLLWRLTREPALRHDPLDADMMQAQAMARAVRRDIHKMRAFVRFRPVGNGRHVAWFEPDHHIVEANAPFFMRRFAQMRWAILTPGRCVAWDGQALAFQPGADAHAAPEPDAGEALWLTYYEHIFNPARLKLATMTREMPRRYWPNLPEAVLIRPLADDAAARSHAMVVAEPTAPRTIRLIDMPRRATTTVATGARKAAPAEAAPDAATAHEPMRTLAELAEAMQACRDCPIGAHATQAVCGEGPMRPSHMIVGEQPGDQEDLAGHPFVGPAGRLLARAMAELGWDREAVYVTNAVKHFKYEIRGQRRMHKTPGQREVEICSQWLDREIAMVQPRHFVALGATAARALLGRQVAITREHGQWLRERPDGIPVLVTWHPSALLRMQAPQRDESHALWKEDLAMALRGWAA